MSEKKLQRWVGIAAVLTLAMLAILPGAPHFSNASRPVRGITNPLLAMEMVRNVSEVDTILSDAPSPDREVMRIKQYADFGFIAGYVSLYVLMSRLLLRQGRLAALTAAALGIAAGFCDVLENLAILRIVDADLSHTSQFMIDSVRYSSLLKWALASAALGLLGILAWRTGRTGLRMVGALNAIAALLGLCGLQYNSFLQLLGGPIAGGLIGLGVLYFRPKTRNPA